MQQKIDAFNAAMAAKAQELGLIFTGDQDPRAPKYPLAIFSLSTNNHQEQATYLFALAEAA